MEQVSDYRKAHGEVDISAEKIKEIINSVHTSKNIAEQDIVSLATDFLKQYLDIVVAKDKIYEVYWMTAFNKGSSRPLVVKCEPNTSALILANTKRLKQIENPIGKPYFINQQVPEAISAQRKQISHTIWKIKKNNKDRPQHLKTKFKVKANQLFLDGSDIPEAVSVTPLSLLSLFPERPEQERIDKFKLSIASP